MVLGTASRWLDQLVAPARARLGGVFPNIPTAFNGASPLVAHTLSHFSEWMLARRRADVEALFAPV